MPHEFSLADDLVMGLRLYSRLPTGSRPHLAPDISRIAMALPIASLIIGIGPAVLLTTLVLAGAPAFLATTLASAAYVAITGAMAEDALADSFDGLFGGQTKERRLEILKDSRHGTFGVAAMIFLVVIRIACLAPLAEANAYAAGALWLAAGILARSGSLWLMSALPPARASGLSADAGRPSRPAFGLGIFIAIALAFILAGPFKGIFGLGLAVLVGAAIAYGWQRLCRHLVGGQTGDLVGGLQALLEIAVLCAFILS